MAETRRERIAAVLAEHPEGLPTPQIAVLVEGAGRRARTWEMLRLMEQGGEVTRCPSLLPAHAVEWRLVPARERRLYRARYKAAAAWNALTPEDRASLPFTPTEWREFMALTSQNTAASIQKRQVRGDEGGT